MGSLRAEPVAGGVVLTTLTGGVAMGSLLAGSQTDPSDDLSAAGQSLIQP